MYICIYTQYLYIILRTGRRCHSWAFKFLKEVNFKPNSIYLNMNSNWAVICWCVALRSRKYINNFSQILQILCKAMEKWTLREWSRNSDKKLHESPQTPHLQPSRRRKYVRPLMSIAYLSEILQPWPSLRKQKDERDPAYNAGLFPGMGQGYCMTPIPSPLNPQYIVAHTSQ